MGLGISIGGQWGLMGRGLSLEIDENFLDSQMAGL